MVIEGINCGYRTTPAEKSPEWMGSIGISLSGVATSYSFGKTKYNPVFSFIAKSQSIRDQLHALTIGSAVTVEPDTGDDLDVGATGTTEMILTNVVSQPLTGSALYNIQVTLLYIA